MVTVVSSSTSEVDVSESVMLGVVLSADCGVVGWRVVLFLSTVLLAVASIACVVLGLLFEEVPEVLGLSLGCCMLSRVPFPPSVVSMLFLICIDVLY